MSVDEWFDWAETEAKLNTLVEAKCPPSAAVLSLVTKADDLDRTWNPTGFYTWQEMSSMITAVLDLTRVASNAMLATTSYKTSGKDAAWSEYSVWTKRGLDYNESVKGAYATNAIIDAPAFKRWVLGTLRAGTNLMRQIEIGECVKPGWLGTLQSFVGFFDRIVAVAKAIGNAIVAVGQGVVRAAEGLFGLWPVIKWGGLGFLVLLVGVYGWSKLQATAEAGRRPIDWNKIFSRKAA